MKANLNKPICILGLMSGTSLDGLDLALCEFENLNEGYSYKILKAKTLVYSADWKEKLKTAQKLSAEDYFALHASYGEFIANEVKQFLKGESIQPEAIASHGHTVFHQPKRGFSTQVGCGATIAARTQITTVCDFRSLDVANGGQGAPLVPIGDKLLFGEYKACLNLGGIANISLDNDEGERIAYDSCEVNLLLNHLSEKLGLPYDRGGDLARSGKSDLKLLEKLNAPLYYQKKGAKSLGREWYEENIVGLIEQSSLEIKDLLATAVEHISDVISKELNAKSIKKVLVTGGGAFNDFLIERIKAKTSSVLIIPSNELVNFKEALIFAFLGYLRLNQEVNTLSSVTGAQSNSIGGAVYLSL